MNIQPIRPENICFDSQHIRTRNPKLSNHHNRWRHKRFDLRIYALTPDIFEPEIQNCPIIIIDEDTTDSTWEYLLWLPIYSKQKSKIVKSSQSMKTQPIRLENVCFNSQHIGTRNPKLLNYQNRRRHNRFDLRIFAVSPSIFEPEI